MLFQLLWLNRNTLYFIFNTLDQNKQDLLLTLTSHKDLIV